MQELLSDFYNLLDQKIEEGYAVNNHDHLSKLTEGLQSLCEKVNHIGLKADENLQSDESLDLEKKFESTFVQYEWIREVKGVLILWRDSIFQYNKSLILKREGLFSDTSLAYLHELSKEKISEAATYIKEYIAKASSGFVNYEDKNDYLSYQSLRANPWSVYQEQIQKIETQSHTLIDQHAKLLNVSGTFIELTEGILKIIESLKSETERIRKIGKESITLLEEETMLDPQRVIRYIDSIDDFLIPANNFNAYKVLSKDLLSEMITLTDVPTQIGPKGIIAKNINFSLSTKDWLNSEIQPSIMEAQEIADSFGNSMKMALMNLKNRLSVIATESTEAIQPQIKKDLLLQQIKSVNDTIDERSQELEDYFFLIKNRLKANLKVSQIYQKDQYFLETSQQYVIGQLSLDQSAWIQRLRQWVVLQSVNLKRFMANVAQEETMSDSEKIVRYIKSRELDKSNTHYNNIFAAQGYIGESFWVGREKELQRITTLVNNWRSGYRGSVILSGKRCCGKTVFGELIISRHFPNKTVRLTPNSTIRMNGRTLEIKDDLNEALEFVKKNSVNDHYVIWIDDIELWQDPKIMASQNVQSLLRHIDNMSAQLFFIVSMSNWFKHYYNQMYNLDKVFQAEINLDYTPEDEILQAIVIRHGATHKILVDDQGHKVLPQALSKMVNRINKLAHNNVGHALNLWSYFTKKIDDHSVMHQPELSYQLPDFVNDENSILLRSIMMNKRTNEYRLRKVLGTSFSSKYRVIVQRLINLGVLVRHVDGMLEIKESIVNEVGAFLERARYIKYKY